MDMGWTYYSVRLHDQVILHPKPVKLDGGLLANGITDELHRACYVQEIYNNASQRVEGDQRRRLPPGLGWDQRVSDWVVHRVKHIHTVHSNKYS